MTERTLELALLLPREAECGGCVDEVGRELLPARRRPRRRGGRLSRPAQRPLRRGTRSRGDDVETFARRAGAQAHCEDHCPLAVHEHGPLDLSRPLPAEDGGERRILHVTGMDCADCAVKLQGALRKERGVRSADVNFGAATLAVAIDPAQTALPRRVPRRPAPGLRHGRAARRGRRRRRAGRPRRPAPDAASGSPSRARSPRSSPARSSSPASSRAAAAPAAAPWLFAAAVVSGGVFVARAAFFSLRARQVDMNVLMTLAVIGAAAIGQWSEAALVVFLFGLGTVLQVATLERTRRAISGLMELAPPTATVLRPCGTTASSEETTLASPTSSSATSCSCAPASARPSTASSSRARPPPTRRR